MCFFTSDSSMKKDKFMQQLNHSFMDGGLTCGFNDFQLAEYVQQKIRSSGRISKTRSVEQVGIQHDGNWVLGPNVYINADGYLVDPNTSQYVWISHLYEGAGIAKATDASVIELPLSTEPLKRMFELLKLTVQHNFMPALLLLGSCAMSLHYKTILAKFLFCPVPIAFGDSGTGKTTALRCGLAMLASFPRRFYSKCSLEKYTDLCSKGTFPIAIDDPRSISVISELTISLYNGAKGSTMKRGDSKPSCMAVISANFTTDQQERYIYIYIYITFMYISCHITLSCACIPSQPQYVRIIRTLPILIVTPCIMYVSFQVHI